MQLCKKQSVLLRLLSTLFVFALLLPGCAWLGMDESEEGVQPVEVANQPYYPKDFREILVPDGLVMNRENSMFVKTTSFNGGILNFQGRLEVNSLIDFFENSMPKQN